MTISNEFVPDGQEVKQADELVRMGGKFYTMQGDSWCDTPLDSWKLVPEKGGYVRVNTGQVEGG